VRPAATPAAATRAEAAAALGLIDLIRLKVFMATHASLPKSELQNMRVIRIAKRVVLLPFTALRGIYRSMCWMWGCWKSAAVARSDDQLRQSRARRSLRGLPPDHVQPKTGG
jgi:hypothetical protein